MHSSSAGPCVNDEVLCPRCFARTTPSRANSSRTSAGMDRVPSPRICREILAPDARNVSPWKIADHLRASDKTILRIISGDDVDAAACPACVTDTASENR